MFNKTSVFFFLGTAVFIGVWYWWMPTQSITEVVEPTAEVELSATSSSVGTEADTLAQTVSATTDIMALYQPLSEMKIGEQIVLASVARTPEQRKQGLSHTPALPAGVVKLFVFPQASTWGFWMKDMNYAIDIIWADEDSRVVHVAADVSPDSYPTSFSSPEPAQYVIETQAGFAAANNIVEGTTVILPESL
jgi:uncharacterized membrane protein (UPF0127 family)